jgi:MarR family transcriptional regulator for hemolysin
VDNTQLLLSGHYLRKLYEKYMQEICDKHNMSKMELDILLFLYHNPQFDTAKDMVEYRFLTKSHVSTALDHLKERRLISTNKGEKDRRKVHLKILPAAYPIIEDAIDRQEMLKALLSENFTETEKETIDALLNKFLRNVQNVLDSLEKNEKK